MALRTNGDTTCLPDKLFISAERRHFLGTHREIFPKSYQMKPKSDCIYHFPIDSEHKRTASVCVPNRSKMVNTI